MIFPREWSALLCAFLLIVMVPGAVLAGHGQEAAEKTGILLAAFGSTVPEARKALDNVEAAVHKAYPDLEIRWAYTSRQIRETLAEEGILVDSPATALAKMGDEGFTHVAVQSLHTIPGEEYNALLETVNGLAGRPKCVQHVSVGAPLMFVTKDMELAVQAILANIPAERKADEAVVLMGHGTHHPGNIYYAGLQYHLWNMDPNILVGTVEGTPELSDVMAGIAARGIKKAYLMPFMAVAGDHAMNDMAGDEPDSWKSELTKAGVECVPVLKGTAEYGDVVAIWVDHLDAALEQLGE